MRIAPNMLTVEDFQDALNQESSTTRALVPVDGGMRELLTNPGAAKWADRRCRGEFTPVPGQVVTVRKSGHLVRPVVELSTRDRILYRALVRRWKHSLPEPDRSGDAYDAFRRGPLDRGEVPRYVVSSDVAACYQYIDHGLLARAILARTGDSDGAEALTSLLAGLMGRSFGLPQQSGCSDVLAEAYLSVVERRLRRQGLRLWRYGDDFRIAVDSWSGALNAVDDLERECRAIGLALNDSKTKILKGATYKETLGLRSEVLQEISREVGFSLTDVIYTPYGEMNIEPTMNEAAAGKVVEQWLDLQEKMLAPDPKSTRKQDIQELQDRRLALRDLLRSALPVLGPDTSAADGLHACAEILRREQELTPLVARYLASSRDAAATISWFEEFLSGNPYLTPWQAWWIAPALRDLVGSYAYGSQQRAWLEGVWQCSTCPEPVKAGIASTVAKSGLVDASSLMKVYESMTETGRPFVARAVGAVASDDDAGAATLLAEDEWVKWAFEKGKRGV